jgi:peptidoglycan/xylan/chitin deacetylase (PgdA/CDA1 family)
MGPTVPSARGGDAFPLLPFVAFLFRRVLMPPLATLLATLLLHGAGIASEQTWIRINQLGYLPKAYKVAVLLSKDSTLAVRGFEIREFLTDETIYRSTSVKECGAFPPFIHSFRLDFSALALPGSYYVNCDGVKSPAFRIGENVFDGTAEFLLRYMRQQRSGFNPFLKDSCHMHDGYIVYHASKDSTHLEVSGGWHDAADYLQYVTTSATAVVQMLFAYEQNPGVFRDSVRADGLKGKNGIPDVVDEAKWGLEWLCKMNPAPGMLFHQLADDRDHLGFRLPTLDTVSYGRGRERPVYFCTGEPQGAFGYKNRSTGIASIAGKFASAFAMGARIVRTFDPAFAGSLQRKALEAYRAGRANPGVCQTAPCRAPYFYEEDNWVDDMELAASQLALLYPDSSFVREAAGYGSQEPVSPWMGAERVKHYQWYPFVNLGHYFLARDEEARQGEFLLNMREGLRRLQDRGKSNPFLFGVPFVWCSNNLVSAAMTQAHLYAVLSGDSTFDEMEAALRDWMFGCNPWGTSMIVGLPEMGVSPRDPHSAFTHLYGYRIDGGLVDGPVYASIFRSLKGVTLSKPDQFREFQSETAVYHDDWADYSTNEPTMDGTASLVYFLSALEEEGKVSLERGRPLYDRGGIVRMDTTRKEIFLVFTGHEFGEGGEVIRKVLRKQKVEGSFFFTGDFYRNPKFSGLIRALKRDGHYLGAHSDKHLLYAAWANRDSLLLTREQFIEDLRGNYRSMREFGIGRRDAPVFLPPYEWYNASVASWCKEVGLELVNFTPGTMSNADYTYPSGSGRYVSSDSIVKRILAFEESTPSGLNGFLLLTHVGVDSRRPDKFYQKLDWLITELRRRGYSFKRLGWPSWSVIAN